MPDEIISDLPELFSVEVSNKNSLEQAIVQHFHVVRERNQCVKSMVCFDFSDVSSSNENKVFLIILHRNPEGIAYSNVMKMDNLRNFHNTVVATVRFSTVADGRLLTESMVSVHHRKVQHVVVPRLNVSNSKR